MTWARLRKLGGKVKKGEKEEAIRSLFVWIDSGRVQGAGLGRACAPSCFPLM